MKSIITLISFLIISNAFSSEISVINNFKDGDTAEEVLTFDGFEGGYLFFTSADKRAVVLEVTNKKVLKKADLINGNYVGQKLKIRYKKVKAKSKDSSSDGTISDLEVLD